MSAAERLASLDAALTAAATEGASTNSSPQEQGTAVDWEATFEAEPSTWLTRSLSVRLLRALLQQHSARSGASAPAGTSLVLLSLAELRLAALPLVGSLLWGPAYQTALGWGRDALQELCCELGLPHEGTAEEDLARQVVCSYLAQKFELPASAIPPGCLSDVPLSWSRGSQDAGAQQAGQAAQQARRASAAGARGRGNAARRRVPTVPRPDVDDSEEVPEGVEPGSRLEVRREVVNDGTEELEFKWVGATVEARLERPTDSDAPPRFLLRYDEDPEHPLAVIERAIISFIDQDELEDVNEGPLRWRCDDGEGSGASSPRSGGGSERGDATSRYLDARIGRAYAGPEDEAFRRDTLAKAADDLLRGDDGHTSLYEGRRRWDEALDSLRLHREASPEAAAARGAALLAGSAGRPPSRRELAALAAWLGRDREGLRASGTSPAAAVEEEFGRRWEELQGLKQRAAEEATAVSLVALGDVDRLSALCRDAGRDFTTADSVGWTPLHFAAHLSRVECLQVLIEAARQRGGAQAFLDAKDRRGRTALHRAVCGADAGTVKELLRAGVSCGVQDRDGRTPLHLAVEAAALDQQFWRVQLLLSEGQNLPVDALDRSGMSALHLAVEARVEECIEALLEARADANLRGQEGETPLHLAAVAGEREAVQLLLDRGADASLRNDDGMTPAELAAEYGDDELEELLAQTALLRRLQSGGPRGPRRLLSSLSSRNMPSAEPDLDADEACVVCMRHRREVILAPCGHRHLCRGCTRTILTGPRTRRSCPICKENIASFVSQVFD